ncbi:hypothetical protein [Streptomyces sp. NPDC060022]|uniref:hypothetical protein n=1 Tax=Streptomyces sp. NPDC060022 TaxID=3347039 RepID=UPI0036CED9FC
MDHDKQSAPEQYEGGEGCLTTLIRIPVRIVVLVLVLPVRMIWDALVAGLRVLDRVLLRPLGRALEWLYDTVLTPVGRALAWLAVAVLVWPWIGLWRYVVVPVVRYGIVAPLVWLHGAVLTPAGHGLRRVYRTLLVPAGRAVGAAVAGLFTVLLVWPVVGLWRYVLKPLGIAADWLVTHLVVMPVAWTYRYVLTPVGHGIAWVFTQLGRGIAATGRGLGAAAVWLVMTLLVLPLAWVYRHVLAPVGREIAAAVGVAWRIAGYISRAVGRALAWLAWHLVGAPVTWVCRTVCTPVGHFVRDAVWAPVKQGALEAGRAVRSALSAARESVRTARRDAWRALVGPPQVTEVRELQGSAARTLGRTTTVPSAAPAPEISLLADKTVERG